MRADIMYDGDMYLSNFGAEGNVYNDADGATVPVVKGVAGGDERPPSVLLTGRSRGSRPLCTEATARLITHSDPQFAWERSFRSLLVRCSKH